MDTYRINFPNQHVSAAERKKPEWYANCCDYVIALGIECKNNNIEEKMRILQGYIPERYYRKALNPYNTTVERYKRFPADMRNYDMMKGVIRRYVGEYIKNPHQFLVGANNPEVVFAKNAKLSQEIARLVETAIVEEIQRSYNEFVNQGNNPEEFNPQQHVDIEAFIKDFNENYIDDISAQGQEILAVIDDITDAFALYTRAYFEFITFGEFYTYADVQGEKLIKRVVSARDAFPVPNDSVYVKDYDMFAERMMMTKQQILDNYYPYFTKEQIKFIEDYYGYMEDSTTADNALLYWNEYRKVFQDVCQKFPPKVIDDFNKYGMQRDVNTNLIEVWHVVWRGEVKKGILTYSDGAFITTRIVDEDYKLQPEAGDISIEWVWESQVFESVRIGTRNNAIYPYKARPIAYNRNGELPYNGLSELIPGYGRFSIIDTMLPYQIVRNIFYYRREMVVAREKLNVLMLAKSLLGKVPEDTIYRMAAEGVLYIDDTEDSNLIKSQQVRYLESQTGEYIAQLTALIEDVKNAALEQVDMTPQRYGEIANNAGKGVTEEGIIRGSMGSVIIEYLFDLCREKDCQRDLDYTKLAWIDGLQTTYRTADKDLKYFSLDVNSHIYADYVVMCKTSVKEREKLEQYRQLAFNASQNGDLSAATAAIKSDNVAQIDKYLKEYDKINKQHEKDMEMLKQQLAEMEQQFEMEKIHTQAEEDRETERLRGYLDAQIQMIKANANIMSFDNGLSETEKNQAEERMKTAELAVEREKIAASERADRRKAELKKQEIEAKKYDSDNKVKIAKTNRNKYSK